MIHIIFRANFWLNLKNSWKESSNIYTTWKVSHTRVLLVLTHHTTWLSHLVGIACFNFSRNLLLSFILLFLALLVIIKQVHLFFWNLNVQFFTLFIWMEQFSIWSANMQRSPNFTYIDVFSFSSKNPSRTLEPLSRDWHKNWQPTCCKLGARICWKVKSTQNSEVSSSFSVLISFEHDASLQTTS